MQDKLDFYKYNTWGNVTYPNLMDSYGSGAHNGITAQRIGAIFLSWLKYTQSTLWCCIIAS